MWQWSFLFTNHFCCVCVCILCWFCCWITGHFDLFTSVNICYQSKQSWSAIKKDHFSKFAKWCQQTHQCDPHIRSTVFPVIEEVLKAGIPIHGGTQECGDCVIVPTTVWHFGHAEACMTLALTVALSTVIIGEWNSSPSGFTFLSTTPSLLNLHYHHHCCCCSKSGDDASKPCTTIAGTIAPWSTLLEVLTMSAFLEKNQELLVSMVFLLLNAFKNGELQKHLTSQEVINKVLFFLKSKLEELHKEWNAALVSGSAADICTLSTICSTNS